MIGAIVTWLAQHTGVVSLIGIGAMGLSVAGLGAWLWHARRQMRAMRDLANAAFEGLIIHKNGRIVDVNVTFAHLIGWPAHVLTGTKVSDLFEVGWPRDDLPYHSANAPGTLKGMQDHIPVEMQTRRLFCGDGYVTAVRDLRQMETSRDEMHRLATHDSITQLPRRGLFIEAVNSAINYAATHHEHLAVVRMGVGFKKGRLSDVPGGRDACLMHVAQALRAMSDKTMRLGRLTEDGFALLIRECGDVEALSSHLERLLGQLQAYLKHDEPVEKDLEFKFSVAVYPFDGADGETLLKHTDSALIRDSEDIIVFYNEAMNTTRQRRFALEISLSEAIEARRIDLAFQAQACLVTGKIRGFEALARWPRQDPPVGPQEFLPIAQDRGLMQGLGRVILRRAFERLKLWPESLTMSVNLAEAQLDDPDLEKLLKGYVKEFDIQPERMCLEISEVALGDHLARHLPLLERLRILGFKLALDEFGAGLSNLHALNDFRFDQIKIARSLIAEADQDRHKGQVLGALIALGRALKSDVIGMGAQTQGEMDVLRRLGCDGVQGYALGHPVPGDRVSDFMQRYMLTMMSRVVPKSHQDPDISAQEQQL
ncbi:GGDEF domain-containing phosphodiesterase [Woodsholea maritima]|uniref:GGDEF domain-containing phosphodiesterase n=1 Tax=Woodsholea maritima TaxID=240237 RepID=UPI00036180C0|nr:GGDEF domain-containing phosphodiesterase [Woodsholea maritima]